jgi:hypothetical protein
VTVACRCHWQYHHKNIANVKACFQGNVTSPNNNKNMKIDIYSSDEDIDLAKAARIRNQRIA